MAVNAKFQADFSSFYAAVQKAESQLQGFGSTAKQTAATLSSLTASFSGQKIIQEAHGIEAAVTRIGGASKLTDAEQKRVSATLSEAIAKYKALGIEVPPQMMKLAEATGAIPPKLSLMDKAANLAKTSFGQMFGAFTLANVATSLLSKLGGEVTRFVNEGLKISAIQQSFDRLAVGLGQDSQKMLTALQTATRGMVSNFDLMQSANKAMLLGLPVTAESMQELAKTATILGKAMGQDATKSFDDLITALGRSSPLILDNLGLTVKVGEANEVYARKLGKTADQLTDAEKKIAFYNAAMEAARKKTEELGEQSKTLGELAATAWIKIGNAISQGVATLNVGIGKAVSSTREFATFLSDAASNGFGFAVAMARIRAEAEQTAKALPQAAKTGPLADVQALINLMREAQALSSTAIAPLTRQQRELALAFDQGGLSAEKIAEKLNSVKGTAGVTAEQIKALLEVQRRNVNETKAHAEAIAKLRDQLSGAKLTGDVRLLQAAFLSLTPAQKQSAEVMERVGEAARKLHDDGAVLTPELHRIYLETTKLIPVTNGLDKELLNIGKSFRQFYDSSVPMIPVLRGIRGEIGDTIAIDYPEDVKKAIRQTELWRTSLGDLSQALSQLAQVSGGGFGSVVRDLSSLVAATNAAQKAFETLGKGMDSLKKDGFSLGGLATVFGGVTGVIASVISGIKAVGSLFGGLFSSKGRDLVKDFAESFGGFDALRTKLETLGMEGERLWVALTQGVGRNNPEEAKAAIDAITKALEKQGQVHAQVLSSHNASLASLLASAKGIGTTLPEEFQPYIAMLKEAGILTTENAAALEALGASNGATFQQMEADAKKFGIELSALGSTFQQQRLTATATEIIQAFDRLINNGADFNGVLSGMADEINQVVQDSIKFGTEIPLNMKPWIEELAKSDRLLGANGERITDLSNLKFGEPIKAGLEDVIAKLQEMIDLMKRGVSGAIKTAFDAIPRTVDVELRARKTGDWDSPGTRSAEGFARGTPGLGYLDFKNGTPTWLHGREAVVPESRVGELAEQIAAALGGGGSSSDTPIINVYVGNEALDARTIRVVRSGVAQGLVPISTSSLVRQSSYA